MNPSSLILRLDAFEDRHPFTAELLGLFSIVLLTATLAVGCQETQPSPGIDFTNSKACVISQWHRGEVGTADAYGRE